MGSHEGVIVGGYAAQGSLLYQLQQSFQRKRQINIPVKSSMVETYASVALYHIAGTGVGGNSPIGGVAPLKGFVNSQVKTGGGHQC